MSTIPETDPLKPPPGVILLHSPQLIAWVLPYGARLMQLWWRAAPGGPRPLTLGYADPASYRQDRMSLGAVCGRYANRLDGARLAQGGQTWRLDANHPLGHCLHGGAAGFGQRDWTVAPAQDSSQVTLLLDSAAGDMGFPGRCQAQVVYRLEGASLVWQAQASLDRPSPVNLLQHSYWNLDASGHLRGHHLQADALAWLPTDARELPLPAQPTAGSTLDFHAGRALTAADTALDAALVLTPPATGLRRVARLAVADLALTLSTDRPLLHLYGAGGLQPTAQPLGAAHTAGAALCLETEDLPNGPALGADVWYGPQRDYSHAMRLDFTTP
ncbi:hypothetical protein [Amphibiibacter pelophylacis]|uniref:Uncharacterized protein n=1 Tax=Amphibiibacter pelophylacis TaxID=1799477 RepID=A0ACC6P1J4_9BURK